MPKLHEYIGLALVAGVLGAAFGLFIVLPIGLITVLALWLAGII